MPKPKETRSGGAETPLDDEGESRGGRPFWSGTISFGLVTIPVDLYTATRATRLSLRMLAPSGSPVVRRYFTDAGKPVESADLQRGYALEKDKFVVVTDDELDSLAPEQSRDIDLTRFVPRDDIPAQLAERAYILAPAGNSNVAYRLLASTLERTKRAGIATFVMRGKQHVVAILGEGGILRAETLRFSDELRSPKQIDLPAVSEPSAQAVKTMRAAISRATRASVPTKELADDYWKRLEALVAKKKKSHKDLVKPPELEDAEPEHLAEVIDLVAVLRKSLGQSGAANENERAKPAASKPAASKPATKKAATKKAATKRTVAKKAAPTKATKKRAARER
ncbi:MAG: Ku protein [Polyangiales bacterium]